MRNTPGLLFDMDGVIVNNHIYHFESWQILAAKYDISIDEEFYRTQMNGRTFTGIMQVLFEKEVSMKQAKEIADEKEQIYRDLFRPHLQLTDGLMTFLDLAKSHQIPMVVGTSAPSENVTFTLDGLDIRSYFKGVIDAQAVTKGKPDPEVYLKCAQLVGRDPENCIVFEDAISGIEAGEKAGCKVIALATSHKKEELNADLIVDDFTVLNLDILQQLLDA